MSVHIRKTDITPIIEEMKALREQLARESAEARDLLKSIVEEIRGVRGELEAIKREDLQVIRKLLGDII